MSGLDPRRGLRPGASRRTDEGARMTQQGQSSLSPHMFQVWLHGPTADGSVDDS